MCEWSMLSPVALMSSPEMGHIKLPFTVYRFLTSVHTEVGITSALAGDILSEHLTAIR